MKITSAFILFLFAALATKAQLSFTMAAGCVGTTQTLTANTGTGTASSYTWAITPAGPVFATPNASTTTIYFPSGGSYTITLSAMLASGLSSVSNTIMVNPLPAITISQSSFTTCINDNYPSRSKAVNLSAAGASTYAWYPYTNTTNTGSIITVRPAASTCYTVYGTAGGCTGFAIGCVTVIPQFSFAVSPAPAIRCLPDSVLLSIVNVQGSATGPASAFSYSWADPPTSPPPSITQTSGTSTVLAFPQNNTTYTVQMIDAAGCAASPVLVSVVVQTCNTTGIQENYFNLSASIFPNPVKNKLNIGFAAIHTAELKFSISNHLGQLVLNDNTQIINSRSEIELGSLPSGIYFLRLEVQLSPTDKRQTVIKLIKE